ncbi:translation initiation factor IF-2 [Hippea maritima]|uniref:Translation initiation factor IF-2 n=1 Tax=Hippea maritima (strain ATCC 700847 / DSM 10411 / MH2) TaxID=760142 RepID=F2LVA4_HIPMA|nr:translation initiation factor IF-2 [Hippea maritima]AEA33688.1 translation initiation factor IF-2 [Hippea maritima DSM 10411]
MKKIRVYEIARRLNTKSNVVIKKLNDMGIEVKSNFSGVEEDKAEKFIEEWNKAKKEAIKEIKSKKKDEKRKKKKKDAEDKDVEEEKTKKSPKKKEAVYRKKELIEESLPQKFKKRKKYKKATKEEEPEEKSNEIEFHKGMTVFEFASELGVDFSDILSKLFELGVLARKNDIIEEDAARLIAEEYGFELKEETSTSELEEELLEIEDNPEDLKERPPIVTVMGHVDHGKTSILDAIKSTNVASREAGGITQHIAAYSVKVDGKYITFLDTPGHEAFTEMRARGAQITDIVVLVVAADDGVMPQTVEAINHAKAANVPIVVAVNKIDKPNANPERVKQELSNYGVVPEEWGGSNLFVNVSAKKKIGIDELLEAILLQAEMMELKANSNKRAKAVVVEAKLDKNRGPVATVVVKEGTLRQGDSFIVGVQYGKVRALVDDKGKKVREVGPSFAAEILGLHGVPEPGDTLIAVSDEKKAKEIAEKRQEELKQTLLSQKTVSLENIFEQIEGGEIRELPIILKTDVYGSVEAITNALSKLSTDEVTVKVIHSAVGAITKTDINLAKASGAIIIGFNVRPTQEALKLANDLKVEVRTYKVIYEIVDDVKKSLSGLLSPEEKEEILGRVEVRQTFKVPRVGVVAGCYVTYGKIVRNANVRILRDGVIIHEGGISSLKRFKEDVSEVAQGYECGVGIEGFNDVKEGDVIEVYQIVKVQREL